MFDNIRADFKRYFSTHRKKPSVIMKVAIFFHNPEMWFIMSYRFGRFFVKSKLLLFRIFGFFYSVIHFYLGYFFYDIIFSLKVQAEKGLYLHHRGIVVADGTLIGKNCSILGQCTIGRQLLNDKSPILGDFVTISVGARVIGNIKVGNNSIIGANSVVTKDVPIDCTAIGIPAKYQERKNQFGKRYHSIKRD